MSARQREAAGRDSRGIEMRPYQLLCLICRSGSGRSASRADAEIASLRTRLRANPLTPVTLRCNVDGTYRFQNPGAKADTPEGNLFNEKRDLDVLQRLGLTPGATRPAFELFSLVFEKIPTVKGICRYGATISSAWRGCARADRESYERRHALGVKMVFPPRSSRDKAKTKRQSAADMYTTGTLRIRPHHLLCMACFHAGKRELAPIAEDNLFEAIDRIQRNPDTPVKLVRGCCMICPPCSSQGQVRIQSNVSTMAILSPSHHLELVGVRLELLSHLV